MSLRALLTLCAVVLSAALASAPARADVFGPIELASASAPAGSLHQQAGEAVFPVISADGRYVAFVGTFAGVPGIWRRDLLSGTIEIVAAGDATMPSISADGRWVSFTTTEQLLPGDTNHSPDVYVRDMEPGEGEPDYLLASAVNGSEEGAEYSFPEEGIEAEFGALASARSAISADGRYVVFVTTARSDLLGGAEPTPAQEVLVRDIATGETRLVSAEYEPAAGRPANGEDRPVQPELEGGSEDGAAFTGGVRFRQLEPNTSVPDAGQNVWVGASISADGSTVAWMGQDLGEQTQLLAGEQAAEPPETAEPLWRRIGEGAAAPIRRITGGSDELNPQCAASGEQHLPEQLTLLDPCEGPFEHYRDLHEGLWGTKVRADAVPQLSADGMTVAFITGARELASGEQFPGAESADDDLYVVDMANGLTRVQSLRRLTAIGGGAGTEEQLEKSSKILDYAVSADGSQVAFTTQRTQFPLGSPTFVSAPAAAPGMIELFDADLANDTLTRVSHGFEGENRRSEELPTVESPGVDPYHEEQGAYSPSFSADGNTLSFASTANNIVYGDGNDRPDVFVVHRVLPRIAAVAQYVSPAPPNPAIVPPWKLGVRAVSLSDGRVRLYVEVPGAGSLSASAGSTVRVRRSAHSAGHGRRRTSNALATRTVASTHSGAPARGEGLVTLTLTLTPPYRALAFGRGLSANLRLSFTAHGHPVLRGTLPARFLNRARGARPRGRTSARHRVKGSASR